MKFYLWILLQNPRWSSFVFLFTAIEHT